jgi:hypothetical protein
MQSIKNKTTWVGIVTLIVGVALGLGIGIWSVRDTRAGNAPTTSSSGTPARSVNERVESWDPFRQMEQMQEKIDRGLDFLECRLSADA